MKVRRIDFDGGFTTSVSLKDWEGNEITKIAIAIVWDDHGGFDLLIAPEADADGSIFDNENEIVFPFHEMLDVLNNHLEGYYTDSSKQTKHSYKSIAAYLRYMAEICELKADDSEIFAKKMLVKKSS